jgi:triphosphatase
MSDPQELELKFEVPTASLSGLNRGSLLKGLESLGRRPANLVSVYFDTKKLKLRRNAISLRIRRTGRRIVQTVKQETGSATFVRNEWEHDIRDQRPDLDLIRKTPLGLFLSKKVGGGLVPVFETRVRRKAFRLQSGESEIELCIDGGTVHAAGKTKPICEVELELKRGRPGDLFRIARQLAEKMRAQLSVSSKAERGYSLLTGEKPGPVKATPVLLTPGTNVQTAFQRIAWACIRQLIANQPIMLRGEPDGLHQMRVALRRLRAATSLFSEMLVDEQTENLKSELKWLAGELGPARELGIFFTSVVKPVVDGKPNGAGVALLSQDIRQRREDANIQAHRAADSARFRLLIIDAVAWIEAGDWINNPDSSVCTFRKQSIIDTAAKELERRWKKLLKRGKRLEELDVRRRHRFRIQGKKLRYAAEFFAAAFSSKKSMRRQKTFVACLERLQDALGDLNDIVVHEKLSEGLVYGEKTGHLARVGRTREAFAAGRLSGREEARIGPVLVEAKKAYNAFAKSKPFW